MSGFRNTQDSELRRHLRDPDPHAGKYALAGETGVTREEAEQIAQDEVSQHVAQSDPHTQYVGNTQLAAAIVNHELDPTAHPASGIVNDSSVAGASVKDALDSNQTTAVDHINNQANPHNTTATLVPYTGTVAASNVEAAIDAVAAGAVDASLIDFSTLPTLDPFIAGRGWNDNTFVRVSEGYYPSFQFYDARNSQYLGAM